MATSAQHCVECDNCDVNPALFLCKTCPGHLCKDCKTVHEDRKITKNHEIVDLQKDRGETLGLLYCEKHTSNKLEWFCSPCKKPMCRKCHTESHNGHKMEELSKVYKDIRRKLQEDKEDIEGKLLPKYREMLDNEKAKKLEISKKSDQVQKQIKDHTGSFMHEVIKGRDQALRCVQGEEWRAKDFISRMEEELRRRIKILTNINEDISQSLGEYMGIFSTMKSHSEVLLKMQEFPSPTYYTLDNFEPGDISFIEKHFSKTPKFTISKESKSQADKIRKESREKVEPLVTEMKLLSLRIANETDSQNRLRLTERMEKLDEKLKELTGSTLWHQLKNVKPEF